VVDIANMHKAILALALLIGVAMYVRYQFHRVIREVTNPNPRPIMPTKPQDSRQKCIICNGTGRAPQFFGAITYPQKQSNTSEYCKSCRGMGWVDNPLYRR
jgi:hypothetical protein